MQNRFAFIVLINFFFTSFTLSNGRVAPIFAIFNPGTNYNSTFKGCPPTQWKFSSNCLTIQQVKISFSFHWTLCISKTLERCLFFQDLHNLHKLKSILWTYKELSKYPAITIISFSSTHKILHQMFSSKIHRYLFSICNDSGYSFKNYLSNGQLQILFYSYWEWKPPFQWHCFVSYNRKWSYQSSGVIIR